MATFGEQFESGQRFASGLIDTYRTARRRRQLGDIQNAQVEQLPAQFTMEDGEQLRAIASARAPDGTPYYSVEPGEDGVSYRVRSNFQALGSNGQMTQPAPVGMAPRSRSRFLGQTFDQAPTPQQMDRARLRAMAGVVGEDDPVRAAALMASMREEDRADQRMGLAVRGDQRAQTQFDATMDDRSERKNIEAGRRAFAKQLQAMPEEQLAEHLGGAFSTDGSGVDAMLTYDPRSKQFIFASKIPGMPSTTMSKAEAINHALGLWELGNGDFNTGLRITMDGLREQRRMGERRQDLAARAAEANATADYRNESLGLRRDEMQNNQQYRMQSLGNQAAARREAAAERADERASRAATSTAQATQYMEDAEGNTVAVTPVLNRQTGQLEYKQQPIGKGLRKQGSREERDPLMASIDREVHAARQGGASREEIDQIVKDAYRRHGKAPPELKAIFSQPINPKTGQRWTAADIEKFNRMHPNDKLPVPRDERGGATGSW